MSRTVRSLEEELARLWNVSQIALVRHVYVVPRDRPELEAQLAREFAGDPEVEVVLDRRRGERRRGEAPCALERRRSERRSDEPWSVHLSQPFRRGRGRPGPA